MMQDVTGIEVVAQMHFAVLFKRHMIGTALVKVVVSVS